MANQRGGLIALLIGVVSIIAAFVFGIASVVPLVSQFEPVSRLQSPGQAPIEVSEPGILTLWHDYRTSFDGQSIRNPEKLPGGFEFVLLNTTTAARYQLETIKARTTISLPDRESLAVGTFSLEEAGTYQLEILAPAGEERVFSVTEGSLFSGMAKFGVRLAIALILGLGGLVLLILGIVFMVRRSPPPAASQAPPPLPR